MHTPGPWQIAKGESKAILAPSPSGKPDRYIQVIYFNGENYSYQSDGDAALIAAAPEMLAALKACVEMYGDENPEDDWTAMKKARAAISRASGIVA